MRFGIAAVAALACVWVGAADADVVTFQYADLGCIDCSGLGVPDNTPLDLTISFDSSSLTPNAVLSAADIVGFDASVGTFHMNESGALGLSFSGTVSADEQSIYEPWLTASTAIHPDTGQLLMVNPFSWSVEHGDCDATDCAVDQWHRDGQIGGVVSIYDLSLTRVGPAPPEPTLADIIRGAVSVDPSGATMGAHFVPNLGLTLTAAAQIGGFNHFNWLQVSTKYPGIEAATFLPSCGYSFFTPVTTPYIDPVDGGMGLRPADSLPYYWDEGSLPFGCPSNANDGYKLSDNIQTVPENHVNIPDRQLDFYDTPNDIAISAGLGDNMEFITSLVGVRDDGSWEPLYTWSWESDNHEADEPEVARNIDSLGTNGGILNVQVLDDPLDVPENVMALWQDNGLRVDAVDAPEPLTISLFAAGLLGLGFRRRRTS